MALQDTSGLAGTILVVGAASRDLTTDDPRGWRLGGAVSYAALALGRLGLRVRALVGADAEAARADELDLLRAAGVELAVARLRRGPVFVNEERPSGRIQLCIEASDEVEVEALPRAWRRPGPMILGPVAGELGEGWAKVAGSESLVALGWQGLLRRLVPGQPVTRLAPAAGALVERADVIGVGVDDVGPDARLSALVDLIRPGATLVVTRGDRGGTALTSHRPARSTLHAYPAIPPDRLVDPTGAGDVFLAALVAASIDAEAVHGSESMPAGGLTADLRFAAAAASLCVEGIGLAGVPALAAVRRRVADVA